MLTRTAFLLGFFLFSSAASAVDIAVDGVHQYFMANEKPIKNITVKNNSDKGFAVDVVVERILGVDDETGVVEKRDASKDFMFAPRQFILPPHGAKSIRAVYVKDFSEDVEGRYQMSFKPRIQQSYENDPDAKRVKAGAEVVVTTGVSLVVAPKRIAPNVLLKRTDEGVVFKNAGNVTVNLRPKVGYCHGDVCFDLPKKILNPQSVWFFPLADGVAVSWYYDVYGETQKEPLLVPSF